MIKRDVAKEKERREKRAQRAKDNALLDAYGIQSENGQIILPVIMKKKRRKKSLFQKLRDKLDREVQSYAAWRDQSLGCRIRKASQCTGKSEIGYHIIPRGKWATRWDLDFMGIGNVVGACSPCNAGENWHRLDYEEHHKKIFGDSFYAALWVKSHESVKHSSSQLQDMIDSVRERKNSP